MLKEMLEERKLPEFLSRNEMVKLIQKEEYGFIPLVPDKIRFTETEDYIPNFCAGKATIKKVDITSTFGDKTFTFPVYVTIPKGEGKHLFLVCINFRDNVPDRFLPVEELVDGGFAVLSFCYNDVTQDNDDMTDGLAGILYPDGKRQPDSAGKLAMWAWAAHRVMDYAQTLPNLNLHCASVCGHSRLGKAALLASATDERFRYAFSCDSGCCGAALSRGKGGEDLAYICKTFPYWFCENFQKYAGKESEMPFDQHYLLAAIAPGHVYVASAQEDAWADPVSEMLSCVAADGFYQKYGKKGFVHEDRLPEVGDEYHEGNIGYHLRAGLHYLGREDWQKYMHYVKRHSLV